MDQSENGANLPLQTLERRHATYFFPLARFFAAFFRLATGSFRASIFKMPSTNDSTFPGQGMAGRDLAGTIVAEDLPYSRTIVVGGAASDWAVAGEAASGAGGDCSAGGVLAA